MLPGTEAPNIEITSFSARPSVRPPAKLRLDRYNHRSLTCGHESIRARSPCAPVEKVALEQDRGTASETAAGNEEGTSREETTATNPKSHSGNRARDSTFDEAYPARSLRENFQYLEM